MIDLPLALGLAAVASQFVALEAATDAGSNADPIAMATFILAHGQAAGRIHIILVARTAIALEAGLTETILAVSVLNGDCRIKEM